MIRIGAGVPGRRLVPRWARAVAESGNAVLLVALLVVALVR